MPPKDKTYWLKLISVSFFAVLLVVGGWREFVAPLNVAAQSSNENTAANKAETNSATNVAPKTSPTTMTEPSKEDETEPLEGCIKCHGKTEPMHRYNSRGDVLDELQNGRDALGLSCTSCHGGNPAAETLEAAHVKPQFPKEWNCKDG